MKPITCDAVRALVEEAGKDWALVLAGDGQTVQYTTWGRAPLDKVFAGDLSQDVSAWVDGGGTRRLSPSTGPGTVHESYILDAAKNKAALERLRDRAKAVLALLERFPQWTALLMRQDEIEGLRRELGRSA